MVRHGADIMTYEQSPISRSDSKNRWVVEVCESGVHRRLEINGWLATLNPGDDRLAQVGIGLETDLQDATS
ncbi:MAG TPA: hypothetical protein VKF81_00430 [Blastocatellia bacterium]|nr:hypothetical protein [Blastocatellia bacterium]